MIARLAVVSAMTSAALGSLGYAFARRVVGTTSKRHIKVHEIAAQTVTLPASARTLHAGTFGLWTPTEHLVVGDILRRNKRRRTVTRSIDARSQLPQIASPRRHVWEGDVFPTPDAIGTSAEVGIPGPAGTKLPAWRIGRPSDLWAIHIHGIRASRLNALRTVPATLAAGYTSLVVTYRGDPEGPAMPGDAATLGLTEWRDVDAAIAYALEHGARQIVLVGWSMGAGIAMLAAERSPHRSAIAGAVLISPALEWRQTITRSAARMHLPLPRACARLAQAFLSRQPLSRVVGLSEPIDFQALDWTTPGRIRIPTLIIHSPGDRTVPIEVSRQVADANPSTVDLYVAPTADHAWEYNVDPDGFTQRIHDWLVERIPKESQLSIRD